MVESKSARILNDFKGFSDETADSAPRYINRLETQSEYITPSRPTFADGGHLKWRVRSEAIILVHNHPSGDPTPSQADVQMTRAIVDIAGPLGISVHDHIIVGKNGHASLKEMRLI